MCQEGSRKPPSLLAPLSAPSTIEYEAGRPGEGIAEGDNSILAYCPLYRPLRDQSKVAMTPRDRTPTSLSECDGFGPSRGKNGLGDLSLPAPALDP